MRSLLSLCFHRPYPCDSRKKSINKFIATPFNKTKTKTRINVVLTLILSLKKYQTMAITIKMLNEFWPNQNKNNNNEHCHNVVIVSHKASNHHLLM
jgi:hypothetical protein